jgi:hypothetical protein
MKRKALYPTAKLARAIKEARKRLKEWPKWMN